MASFTGFFSQQLIQFRDCFEKDTTAVVTISKCNSYAQTGGEIRKMHPVDFAPMVAAVNVGVTQPVEDLTNVLSSGCISGNCSFPATDGASFSTIAMSRSCTDITAHIRTMNESTRPGNPYHNLSNLALDYGDNKNFKWQKDDPFTVLISWTNTECKSVLLTIYFVFRSSGNDYNWKATKCAIFPTIDTYGASIRNNILEETLIDSVPLRDIRAQFAEPPVVDHDLEQEYVRWGYKMTTNTTIRNGVRASCEGSENPAPDHVKFMKKSDDPTYVNTEGQTTESAGWKWWYYPRDCIWSIHRFSALVMHQTLREMFVDQEITMGNGHGVEASAHMRQIFLDGKMTFDTVNERMKDLVTSMTAVIRAYGDNGDDTAAESAKGEVWINTTCIYTRWPWAIFPVVMIGLSGLFLMLVVIENRGVEHDRLWKSSFLAALFCEVETQDRPVRKAEMLATAESTSVSLEGKNSGVLRLISH
ncbi:hypothetical protein J1614_000814 [Plenodomus biglobosus]|nr:hypothetical protein J1614_000814 [Plenodomus biglobosus]